MTSISDIPPELLLDIVDYLKPSIPSIDSDEVLAGRHHIIKRLAEGPTIFDEKDDASYVVGGTKPAQIIQTIKVSSRRNYSDLRALRQANRQFYEICNPAIYAELDIIPQKAAVHAASRVLSQYAQHVRYLNIAVTDMPLFKRHVRMYQGIILEALDSCRHCTSLAIYYDDSPSVSATDIFTSDLSHKVVRLVQRGSVSLLGVYSRAVLGKGYSWGTIPKGIPSLLNCLAQILRSTPSLTHLEIASEPIPHEIYSKIRSSAIVQSLTLRLCIPTLPGEDWRWNDLNKWMPNSNLTRLQLVNCQGAHPAYIAELVRHFPSLRYLLVTGCGDHFAVRPPPRAVGWSHDDNALWRRRVPLNILHVELMDEWEILAMGTIPCKTLIATAIQKHTLGECFNKDPELFPCLALLRTKYKPPERRLPAQWTSWDSLWKDAVSQRRVVITEDAVPLVNDHTEGGYS